MIHSSSSHSDSQLSSDINWILTSPPLLTPAFQDYFCDPYLPDCPAAVFSLPYPLTPKQGRELRHTLNSRRNHLLGIYYETLWQFLMQQHYGLEVLASNLQVQKHTDTLGEYDLIYQHPADGSTRHRELAVKFYLGVPDGSEAKDSHWNQWIGPGLKDRMDRKLARMLNHQITLSDTTEGKAALEQRHIPSVNKKEILLQGYLFYPATHHCSAPTGAHPDHLRGYWVNSDQLADWSAVCDQQLIFAITPKHLWLAPLSLALTEANIQTIPELQRMSIQEPLMIMACDRSGHQLQERFRFFLVPDHWPEQAQRVIQLP